MLHDDYLYIFLTHTKWANSFDNSVHGVCEATTLEGHQIICPYGGRTGFRGVWMSED